MAIDTQTKRRSVQAYTLGLMRPVPDGDITANDRATETWLYSGLFDDGGGAAPAVRLDTFTRRRSWSRGGRRG